MRSSFSHVGAEGAILVLSPCPIMLARIDGAAGSLSSWRLIAALVACIASLTCAYFLFRRPRTGKFLGALMILGSLSTALPYLAHNPFAALIGSVAAIGMGFALTDMAATPLPRIRTPHSMRCTQRSTWAAVTVPVAVMISFLPKPAYASMSKAIIIFSATVSQLLFLYWAVKNRSDKTRMGVVFLSIILLMLPVVSVYTGFTRSLVLISSTLTLAILHITGRSDNRKNVMWEILTLHPARVFSITFLALCGTGTMLLLIPAATSLNDIAVLDAAFTAVSSVCVTGLVVLDTPNDFTILGQTVILLLIQLGGLGIMSITTMAMHVMGRRMSLRQERLMTSLTNTAHRDLISALVTILKFTFTAEAIGALMLAFLFYRLGDTFGSAVLRGVFTAVSAFCNAGFALQSSSLVPYCHHPLILHTVAVLIIFGGLAPATSLIIPQWFKGRTVPVAARITLFTTAVLLITGTCFLLAFEWNGIFSALTIADKCHNAWFQSVTLRTAGFNSVAIDGVASPTFLVMIFFMFIGGSPGSTAGGIKTTTIGILIMTFWTNITNRNDVIIQNRRIRSQTIYRAITIVISGACIWFIIVLMLEATQPLNARSIIFEATSAIGTVGLSIGATAHLDEIGKTIIILAMFIGRIGPMTLFMLLSDDHFPSDSRCPDVNISLT